MRESIILAFPGMCRRKAAEIRSQTTSDRNKKLFCLLGSHNLDRQSIAFRRDRRYPVVVRSRISRLLTDRIDDRLDYAHRFRGSRLDVIYDRQMH